MKKNKFYTQREIDEIVKLRKEGKTANQIAEILGRTPAAIYAIYREMKNGVERKRYNVKPGPVATAPVQAPVVQAAMSPREMIKKLYNLGYRIENNQLVCYVRQTVKISDIINED